MLKSPNIHLTLTHPATRTAADSIALLLAGGDGRRLQDLTREIAGTAIPKQYCRLWHGSSLLQAAISRASLFTTRDRISVIVNQDHLHFALEQLSPLPTSNILVQPLNLDTGPGILFSLLKLEKNYQNAIVAVFPTDHFINDDAAFVAHVRLAGEAIQERPDKIAVLGIVPDRPETGYGYILPSGPLGPSGGNCQVEAFVEKPDIAGALRIVAKGGLWNTFVMVFKLDRMLSLVREVVPRQFEKLSQLRENPEKAPELYRSVEPWNFSTQVLASIPQHLIVHEVADVHWSDWGTRESVERTFKALNVIPFWKMPDSVPGRKWAVGSTR